MLLDLAPEDGAGLAALASLRATAPGLPIIVLVAGDDDPLKAAALAGGAHDYLVKGQIDADRLQRTLRHVCERAGAQQEAAQGEERFRRVFEDSTVGMALSESDGRFVQVNRAFCQMLGFAESELLGRTFLDITYPEDRERTAEYIRQLITDGGNSMQTEKRYVHKSGRVVWAQLSVSLLRDATGAPQWFIGQVQDITERKRVEEELRFTQVTMDQAADAIYWMDREGRLVYVNQAACRMLDYTREELLALSLMDLDPGITPEVWRSFWEMGHNGETHVLEARHRGRSGVEIPIEVTSRYIASSDRAVRCAFVRDIRERKRVEAAQRESEERYRNLFENMLEGFAYCRMEYDAAGQPVDWVYLEVNSAFEWITGLKDVIGRRVTSVIPSLRAGNPELFAAYGRVARTGQPAEFENEVPALGSWFRISAFSPAPDHFVAVFEDITERKRAEAALRESEERFRIMADSTLTIMWVTDAAGGNLFVNRTYREFFGIDAAEVQGSRWQPMIHPEDAAVYVSGFQRAVADRARFLGEMRMQRSDGEWRWLESHAEPRFAPDGEFLGHVGVCLDITERKQGENVRVVLLRALEATSASDRLEEFLEEIRQSLGTLMDTTNFFVALYDPQKQVYRFPCFADEHDAPPPPECPLPGSLTDYVRQSGGPLLLDSAANERLRAELGLRRSGTPSHSWLGVPLKTAERIIGVMVVQSYRSGALFTPRDLELLKLVSGHIAIAIERKRALDALLQSEAQLRQAQKMEAVGRLAGGVAHDFNNLLTTILGYSELALLTLPPASRLADGITQIRKAAERAAALTRQLLAFSRKQVLQPKVLCLNDVVADMEKMLHRLIGEDVVLVTQLGSELGMVRADPGQLEQVIMNLVVNARDAMAYGGEVAIETSARSAPSGLPAGRYVELSVRDSGCGMDADTLARIFEPFFTTKEPGKGTGLGLSTVYGIIEQSGGYIHVESRLGNGTAFRIYLPCVDAPADLPEVAAASVAGEGRETILLVEDEPGVRQLTRDLLRGRGYTVLEAACGADALAVAAETPGHIDLMLTDMIMPGLSGRELAVEMVRHRPGLKLLFISGYAADFSLDCDLLNGGKAFLAKPFTANALCQKVRQILDEGVEEAPVAQKSTVATGSSYARN